MLRDLWAVPPIARARLPGAVAANMVVLLVGRLPSRDAREKALVDFVIRTCPGSAVLSRAACNGVLVGLQATLSVFVDRHCFLRDGAVVLMRTLVVFRVHPLGCGGLCCSMQEIGRASCRERV